MFRKNNQRGRVSTRFFLLILAFSVAVLLIGMTGSYAWMRHTRTLQTITKIQVFDLSVVGPTSNTLAMNLGEINSGSDNSPKSYVFGVKSNVSKYWIQLGYTTNTSFQFKIYQAEIADSTSTGTIITEAGVSFKKGNELTNLMFSGQDHPDTYKKGTGTYDLDLVQSKAEPYYQQYGPITTQKGGTQYYIVDVSWSDTLVNKETDMVYLTVGTNGIDSN